MSSGPMPDAGPMPVDAGMIAPPELALPRKLHDITIRRTVKQGCAKVENVPPEEFGITRRAKSIRDADYCYHQTRVSESTLIAQGYDKAQVKKLGTASSLQSQEDEARDTVEDDSVATDGDNDATRLIWKTEHYVKCDYDGSGKPRLWRVTTGGDDLEVLTKNGKPDVVKVDMLPFAAMTPIIMPHRFFGRSVADIVMDIQRIKTALTRGYLDQLYLTVNPPVEVAMSGAHDKTIDDLLVNRPGKIVRTQVMGSINYHRPSSQGAEILPAIEYFDATREWRTGVTRQGQGIDAKALADQSATAANQQFSMAQARMRLIARIFAETGVKDLFLLLHATIRRNDRAENTVRLRGKWVPVNPREWKKRNDLTVTVGINGSKEQQLLFLNNLLGIQEKILAQGGMGLAKPANVYNALKKMVESSGLKSVEPYFTDPEATDEQGQLINQPPPPPPDPKMLELQAKNEIEKTQAQADIATTNAKAESDITIAREKAALQERLALMEAQLSQMAAAREEERKEREFEQKLQMQAREHQQAAARQTDDHMRKSYFAEDNHQMKVRHQEETAQSSGDE